MATTADAHPVAESDPLALARGALDGAAAARPSGGALVSNIGST